MLNIKCLIGETIHFPGVKMYTVEVIGTDNKIYTTDILPSEWEIYRYIKNLNIPYAKEVKLMELIQNFGCDRYNSGVNDAEMSID